MTYVEIGTIKDIVRDCLTKYPSARNNDDYLFIRVCECKCPEIINKPFTYVLFHRNEFGIPAYESVTRVRRKVQEECPDLRAVKEVEQLRAETEIFMREWAVS